MIMARTGIMWVNANQKSLKKKKDNKGADYSLLQGERKLESVRQRSGGLTWQFKKKSSKRDDGDGRCNKFRTVLCLEG